eukprot:GFUD01019872.1.p1 GENE.GFUD01019872.1~~GFUD01019872.1.p1  ORF type:complete len:1115 (+),score=430.62 GFUD01019872.1:234-3578(+)
MPGEDPWDIPPEVVVTPQPLIGFLGLDPEDENQQGHQKVWEMFTSNRGLDRQALNFSLLTMDTLDFPVAKPPRTSYEWFLPRGILKRNWMNKHLQLLPSVVVLFFTTPTLSTVSSTVGKVRMALTGRQTKLAVVLLQDVQDPDTVTSVCTECSISSRAVFTLSPTSPLAAVVQLEATLQELASNYYHGQVKTVKSHRDLLNRATHLQLLVRHSFKVGFLSELKGDLHSAYKSYTSSYQLLLETRLTEHNTAEVRTVAGLVNFKICRLAFRLNLPRDAITQFRKHLEQWRAPPGPPQLSWEQAAWQAGQAAAFGQQFVEACRGGQAAVQTQHPGIYFHLAAEYSISRRKLADSLCSMVTTYPCPDPLQGMSSMEYYGQRPWRVGKQEPSDLAREKEGIEAMQFRERTRSKHSQTILDMLVLATEQFKLFNCPRMTAKLTLQMAEEKMVMMDYKGALDTLIPCLPAYRQEKWPTLLFNLLSTSLKCSFLSCNLSIYSALCLELCGLPRGAATWMTEEQRRVWSNFLLVLESGRPPLPEPSLTAKYERASVGAATKGWATILAKDQQEEVDISSFLSCVDVSVLLPGSVKSDQQISVRLVLSNLGEGLVTVQQVSCNFSNQNYDKFCISKQVLELQGGKMEELVYQFKPDNVDVGGKVAVDSVCLKIGGREELLLTLIKNCPKVEQSRDESFQYSSKPAMQWEPVCMVEPRQARVIMEVEQQLPVMVGEWFTFKVVLNSKEEEVATGVEVSCWLRDRSDPLVADTTILSLEAECPASPISPMEGDMLQAKVMVAKVDSVSAEAREMVNFYLQASTVGMRVVVLQLSYMVGESKCQSTQMVELTVMQPFSFTTTFLTEALDETMQANTDEVFCICCSVSNLSPHPITISSSRMESSSPVTAKPPTMSISSLSLYPKSTVEQIFPALVTASSMLPQLDSQTITPGKFIMCWTREGEEVINQTTFDLPSLKLSRSSLYVECLLPPFGVLRTPLQATYTFHNRSQDIQEFLVTTDPSDAFMFSGPKQAQIKLFPTDLYTISLIFYPLVCGSSPLPKLRVSSTDGSGAQETLERLLPSHLVIMPKERREREAILDMEQLSLNQAVVLDNLPFSGATKKVIKG